MWLSSKENINWFIVLLVIFFISEAFYKYLLFSNLSEIRIAGSIKLVALILMFNTVIKSFKENFKGIILVSLIGLLYIVGQLVLPNNENILKNLEHLANSVFIIILLLFFNTLNLNKKQKQNALKAFEIVVIFNSIAVILGFILNIEFLRTYGGSRFGFNGLLMKSSYSSYFYLISMFYYTNKYWINKKGYLIIYILILCATILTGTKASLLAVFLCFVYLFIKMGFYKKPRMLSVLSFVLLALMIIIYNSYDLK